MILLFLIINTRADFLDEPATRILDVVSTSVKVGVRMGLYADENRELPLGGDHEGLLVSLKKLPQFWYFSGSG